jgi:hypothetical protein
MTDEYVSASSLRDRRPPHVFLLGVEIAATGTAISGKPV